MCGRYSIFAPTETLERRFDATATEAFEPRYNAAPGQRLPVVLNDDPGTIASAQWGLVPAWAGDPGVGNRRINARAETLATKPSFRDAYECRRCLVLADGFYEWRESADGKRPYRVVVGDGEPFAMAGLWEVWRPEATQTSLSAFGGGADPDATPEPVTTFTVVTTTPNDVVADLHDRMAVVLPRGREAEWLETGDESLLEPFEGEMDAYPVSTAVGDPSNDSPDLVRPVDADA